MADSKKRMLATELLVLDDRLQCREEVPQAIIDEYREAWKAQAKFPPVKVYAIDDEFLVVDGFCRVMSASAAGKSRIPCEVFTGAFEDALKAACGANASHGLRRSNADKRKAALIAIRNFPGLSSREIADICGVSHVYIASLRDPEGKQKPAKEPVAEAVVEPVSEPVAESIEEDPFADVSEKSNVAEIEIIRPDGWSCSDCGSNEQRLSDGGYLCRACLLPVGNAIEPVKWSNPENTRQSAALTPEKLETFPDPDPEKMPKVHQVWGQFIRACSAAQCSGVLRAEIESITKKLQGLQ